MHTLIIDTSGRYSTAAVSRDGALAGFTTLEAQPLIHLHGQIREMCAHLSLEISRIGRIAVVSGPGSWTGLNIGVTAAKTLAQVLRAGVVELSSLDALVAAERWLGGQVHALLDAKRGNVYCAAYPTGAAGRVEVKAARARVLAFADWCEAVRTENGTPLVVEYGDVFGERLAECLPGSCQRSRSVLTPEGLLEALLARGDEEATGAEAMSLAPRYMQRLV
jgi:tRNA threonylcarbamoyladenosine biosynthesis protein TsaB